ncbi:MAG: hypothetical protein ACLQVI_03375 [Polyangiaceae bacterium]
MRTTTQGSPRRGTPFACAAHVGFAAFAACVMAGAACNQDEPAPAPVTVNLTPGATAAVATAPPRDHLVPGELLEGTESAFGLKLPRGTVVENAFPQQVFARCGAKATDVANYIRPRVSMGTVAVGAASTIFERVQVASNPGRELVIRVEDGPLGTGSRITVRDVTPPPVDPTLTDEQRWRQVGMTPGGGHIADPTHLH